MITLWLVSAVVNIIYLIDAAMEIRSTSGQYSKSGLAFLLFWSVVLAPVFTTILITALLINLLQKE